MYQYNIYPSADDEIFYKQCAALEKHIPNIEKKELIVDPLDDSKHQIYFYNEKKITVHNSSYIDSVFVDSEVELTQFFN